MASRVIPCAKFCLQSSAKWMKNKSVRCMHLLCGSYSCDTIGSASFYAYATEHGITVSSEVCTVNITEPPEPESDPFTWGDDISGNRLHMKNGHPTPVTAAKMNDFISRVNDKCNKNISGMTADAVIDRSSTGQFAKCATALDVAYNEKNWGYKSFCRLLKML